MKRKADNLIEKLEVQVETGKKDNSTAFLSEVSDFSQHEITRWIEEILDEINTEHKLIIISKLELDLGQISWADKSTLKQKLKTKLLEQLQFPIVSQSHLQPKYADWKNSTAPTSSALAQNTSLGPEESRPERWLHFLQYGHFPWWDNEATQIDFDYQADLRLYLTNNKSQFSTALYYWRKTRFLFLQVFRRLQEILKEDAVPLLLAAIQQEKTQPVIQELFFMRELFSSVSPSSEIEYRQSVWWAYFQIQDHTIPPFVAEVSNTLNIDPELIWKKLLEKHFNDQLEYPLTASMVRQMISSTDLSTVLKNYTPAFFERIKHLADQLAKTTSLSQARWQKLLSEISFSAKRNSERLIALQLTLEDTLDVFQDHFRERLIALWNEQVYLPSDSSPVLYPERIDEKEPLVILSGKATKDDYEWLLRYLKTGSLPWIQRELSTSDIEAVIQEMFAENPEFFIQYFKKIDLLRFPQIWARIERQFSEETKSIFTKALNLEHFQNKLAEKEHREKALKSLFTEGLIPWMDLLENNEDEILKIFISFFQEDPAFFKRALQESKLMESAHAQERVEYLLGSKVWQFILEKSGATYKPEAAPKALELSDISNRPDHLVYLLEYYFEKGKFPEAVSPTATEILESLLRINTPTTRMILVSYYQRFPEKIRSLLKDPDVRAIRQIIEEVSRTFSRPAAEEPEPPQLPDFLKKKDPRQETEADKLLPTGTILYVRNAGLVLLHPFINRFFTLLKLVEKRKFVSPDAQEKAVHFLQYLLFEKTDTPEFELTLNKILCGMAPVLPVKSSLELSKEEHELCQSLLKGVIENWSILKNTSIENFRASFLLRDGKLTKEPDGWRLRVEQKGFDVLLKQIPWSYNTVKLPWMNEVIHVDWA